MIQMNTVGWTVQHYLMLSLYRKYQSRAHDNSAATMWPCFQATKLYVTSILLHLVWLLRLETETLLFFDFFLVPEGLLRCRVVVVAKLYNCRVPSSGKYQAVPNTKYQALVCTPWPSPWRISLSKKTDPWDLPDVWEGGGEQGGIFSRPNKVGGAGGRDAIVRGSWAQRGESHVSRGKVGGGGLWRGFAKSSQ